MNATAIVLLFVWMEAGGVMIRGNGAGLTSQPVPSMAICERIGAAIVAKSSSFGGTKFWCVEAPAPNAAQAPIR